MTATSTPIWRLFCSKYWSTDLREFVTPPATEIWLSFIITISNKPIRWFFPPPISTCKGSVLKVKRTTQKDKPNIDIYKGEKWSTPPTYPPAVDPEQFSLSLIYTQVVLHQPWPGKNKNIGLFLLFEFKRELCISHYGKVNVLIRAFTKPNNEGKLISERLNLNIWS